MRRLGEMMKWEMEQDLIDGVLRAIQRPPRVFDDDSEDDDDEESDDDAETNSPSILDVIQFYSSGEEVRLSMFYRVSLPAFRRRVSQGSVAAADRAAERKRVRERQDSVETAREAEFSLCQYYSRRCVEPLLRLQYSSGAGSDRIGVHFRIKGDQEPLWFKPKGVTTTCTAISLLKELGKGGDGPAGSLASVFPDFVDLVLGKQDVQLFMESTSGFRISSLSVVMTLHKTGGIMSLRSNSKPLDESVDTMKEFLADFGKRVGESLGIESDRIDIKTVEAAREDTVLSLVRFYSKGSSADRSAAGWYQFTLSSFRKHVHDRRKALELSDAAERRRKEEKDAEDCDRAREFCIAQFYCSGAVEPVLRLDYCRNKLCETHSLASFYTIQTAPVVNIAYQYRFTRQSFDWYRAEQERQAQREQENSAVTAAMAQVLGSVLNDWRCIGDAIDNIISEEGLDPFGVDLTAVQLRVVSMRDSTPVETVARIELASLRVEKVLADVCASEEVSVDASDIIALRGIVAERINGVRALAPFVAKLLCQWRTIDAALIAAYQGPASVPDDWIRVTDILSKAPDIICQGAAPYDGTPNHEHPLGLSDLKTSWLCDVCRTDNNDQLRYRCTSGCDWDMCEMCWNSNVVGRDHVPVISLESLIEDAVRCREDDASEKPVQMLEVFGHPQARFNTEYNCAGLCGSFPRFESRNSVSHVYYEPRQKWWVVSDHVEPDSLDTDTNVEAFLDSVGVGWWFEHLRDKLPTFIKSVRKLRTLTPTELRQGMSRYKLSDKDHVQPLMEALTKPGNQTEGVSAPVMTAGTDRAEHVACLVNFYSPGPQIEFTLADLYGDIPTAYGWQKQSVSEEMPLGESRWHCWNSAEARRGWVACSITLKLCTVRSGTKQDMGQAEVTMWLLKLRVAQQAEDAAREMDEIGLCLADAEEFLAKVAEEQSVWDTSSNEQENAQSVQAFVLRSYGAKDGLGLLDSWRPKDTGGLVIDLGSLHGGDKKCRDLCVLLPAVAYTLACLRLSRNALTDEGGQAIADVIPYLPKLRELDLRHNAGISKTSAAIRAAAPSGCKVYFGDEPVNEDWRGTHKTNTDLVRNLCQNNAIRSESIVAAFLAVDRGLYVPANQRDEVYNDRPFRHVLNERDGSALHMSAPDMCECSCSYYPPPLLSHTPDSP